MFLNSTLSDRGGAHRWLLSVLSRLQGKAETLLCVGRLQPGLDPEDLARAGQVLRVKGLDRRGSGERGLQGALSGLQRIRERFEPAVIHVNDVLDPDLLGWAADSGRGVMTVQDHRFFCPGRGRVDPEGVPCQDPPGEGCLRCFSDRRYGMSVLALTRRRLEALGRMARITVLSRYMAGELAAAGLPQGRVEVIPPFVDGLSRADAVARPGAPHLLAGRLCWHKGTQVALQAARRCAGRPALVVAGDGPLAGEVDRAARGSGGWLRFAGWQDRRGMAALLRGAGALWLPGMWAEPFGLVGLEAMSLGLPVIAARVGGVPEWLDAGVDGLLVAPGHAEDLADAARALEGDPALAGRLGEAGQRRVRQDFAPDRLMARLLALYGAVAGGG